MGFLGDHKGDDRNNTNDDKQNPGNEVFFSTDPCLVIPLIAFDYRISV